MSKDCRISEIIKSEFYFHYIVQLEENLFLEINEKHVRITSNNRQKCYAQSSNSL